MLQKPSFIYCFFFPFVTRCLSYFSFVVLKTLESQLKGENIYVGSQLYDVQSVMVGKAWQRMERYGLWSRKLADRMHMASQLRKWRVIDLCSAHSCPENSSTHNYSGPSHISAIKIIPCQPPQRPVQFRQSPQMCQGPASQKVLDPGRLGS